MAGMIYIIGMGPGDRNMMTDEAFSAMKKSDVIVGYTVYVDLVKEGELYNNEDLEKMQDEEA